MAVSELSHGVADWQLWQILSEMQGNTIGIEYVPRPGLGRLAIVNFLLNLVTLTIYRFWAKTNVRKHIWSCVHINGQPLEYTGRGLSCSRAH